ncbi:MAG: metallopeptidase family protein [Phycisphaerales bacterium]|nr:metallopeptidase family protein [Phycisphaerales bacterium]
MRDSDRERFDELFDQALEDLPPKLHELIEEVPVIIEDEPGGELLDELAREAIATSGGMTLAEAKAALRDELCGLHSGPMITEHSYEDVGPPQLPAEIRIFRRGIVMTAGGWDQAEADEAVAHEIAITLLHEIGHHFGLDEDDLAERGYA